ncbi:MAG: hypothetical protein GY832_37660 [Chloroflexi bacterium]|nr:hypothetical protein [Chloroflexota bacterium]
MPSDRSSRKDNETSPIAVTLLIIDALEALEVPYLIGGSWATANTDMVADLRIKHADPLAQALIDAFYVDAESIRDAIQRSRSFNVIHLETMFKADVFVRKRRPFDQAQFERRIYQIVATGSPERAAYGQRGVGPAAA